MTASVVDQATLPDGTVKLLVKGLERATIVQLAKGQFLTAEVAPVEETRGQEAAAFNLLSAVFEEFIAYSRSRPYPTSFHFADIREPSVLGDAIAPLMPVGIGRRQDLLETSDVIARLEKILAMMKAVIDAGSRIVGVKRCDRPIQPLSEATASQCVITRGDSGAFYRASASRVEENTTS